MKPLVTLTYGLPASGKSTAAARLVRETSAYRVNLDDMRAMMSGDRPFSHQRERVIQKLLVDTVHSLTSDGNDVVVDNTHVNPGLAVRLKTRLASTVRWAVIDLSDVSLGACMFRDAQRQMAGERFVGRDVIEKLHQVMQVHKGVDGYLSVDWLTR